MSSLTPPGPQSGPAYDPALPPPSPYGSLPQVAPTGTSDDALPPAKAVEDLGISLAVVFAWFAVAAVLGAVIWNQVVTLPEFTRIATTGTMDEQQLSHQFAISGWFLVIAAVGGLVSGIALMFLRRKQPIAMVVLIALGSGLATWVMLQVGLALGPEDPNTALSAAKLGDKVPVQLKPDVNAVYFAWSIAALFGSILSLWILETMSSSRRLKEQHQQYQQQPGAASYYG